MPGEPDPTDETLFVTRSVLTVLSVLPLQGQRLAIVNDTNFGARGRNPNPPNHSDFVVVRVPGLRGR